MVLPAFFRPLGDFCRGMEGCAAGNADEEAFGFGKGLGCRIGFVCRDGKYFIVNRLIEGFGDEIRADTPAAYEGRHGPGTGAANRPVQRL